MELLDILDRNVIKTKPLWKLYLHLYLWSCLVIGNATFAAAVVIVLRDYWGQCPK